MKPDISRRNFIKGAAAVAGSMSRATAVGGGLSEPQARLRTRGGRVMIEDLSQGLFEKLIESEFQIGPGSGARLSVKLVNVSGESTATSHHFSLLFEGPKDPRLPQGIHTFSHPEIGAFDLFIVPIGQSSDKTSYEAIFNLLGPRPGAAGR